MGKVKDKIQEEPSGVIYDPRLDNVKVTFTSNKLEEANKLVRNLELPKFDKDGNYIP